MQTAFKYCPKCQSSDIEIVEDRKLSCHHCGLVYYQNVATATAVILRKKDEILFTIRNRDPKKGMLDLPGGFVDPDETAEQGAQRELKEELNLEIPIENFSYFQSRFNHYEYKDILYKTCDLIFIAEFPSDTELTLEFDEIQDVKWIKLDEIKLEEIGFDSLRKAVEDYINKQK